MIHFKLKKDFLSFRLNCDLLTFSWLCRELWVKITDCNVTRGTAAGESSALCWMEKQQVNSWTVLLVTGAPLCLNVTIAASEHHSFAFILLKLVNVLLLVIFDIQISKIRITQIILQIIFNSC